MELYIGLMSGTSMDGIDVALVDLTSNRLIQGLIVPYTSKTSALLQAVIAKDVTDFREILRLHTYIGRDFAAAVLQLLASAKLKANQIIAIGSHGQTIAHEPFGEAPFSLQLGCPHTIAALTGISVVADFRTRDVVLGGQGAPFAPIYHAALFADLPKPLAVLNLGGIANVTWLFEDCRLSGWDLGPANALMDAWTQRVLGKPFDEDGRWAATGVVNQPLLTRLLADSFFHQPSPKSVDKAYFSLEWLVSHHTHEIAPVDVQATLLQLTLSVIVSAVQQSSVCPAQVIVCGGGVHNQYLFNKLVALLAPIVVINSAEAGVHPDYIEAMLFAWLAKQALQGIPTDLSSVTGSQKAAVLGVIYPA